MKTSAIVAVTFECLVCGVMALYAQTVSEPVVPLRSLKVVPVPEPPELEDFIRDRQMALVLGKAFFWDMQTGSDGIQSCGTCHFHAGADPRSRNVLSPALGALDANWLAAPVATFAFGGPNYQLLRDDFPFRKLADPNDRRSAVLSDSAMTVSSPGIHKSWFVRVTEGSASDETTALADPVFSVDGINVRQVPHRAAPSVINAVFNLRQFWDGRAQSEFNGVNPWGDRDPSARVLMETKDGLRPVRVRITNASLASQAVGPPTSPRESSAAGRTFLDFATKLTPHEKKDRDTGRKLIRLRPLALQLVTRDDSVLGRYSAWPAKGLRPGHTASYDRMIERAFHDKWWRSKSLVVPQPDGSLRFISEREGRGNPDAYTLLEYNFALFFGLAVQMYETTLVSDDTPFDRYMEGQHSALSLQQIRGLEVFNSNIGRCVNCHGGAEFTNASVTSAHSKRLFRRSGNLLDTGFNNIGLRPPREDVGLGANDPWGKPLSVARQVKLNQWTEPTLNPPYTPATDSALGIDGAFKTPGLRNVELTAPYFHNGSHLTLRQVVDFYSRA